MFEDRTAIQELRNLGIRGLDPGAGPNKDTETTYRHKFGVVTGGGVRYPTKVEVSFRSRHDRDEVLTSRPSPDVVKPYLGDDFSLLLSHYARNAAVRQKVLALAGRQFVQARDKIRKSDGTGHEYFYGYDRTRGQTIKSFFVSEIGSVSPTGQTFAPQYSVEF